MAIPPLVWLAGTAAAVWFGIRKLRRFLPAPGNRELESGTDTVRCAHCGVFVPKTHAVEHQGQWFCGRDHAGRPQKS